MGFNSFLRSPKNEEQQVPDTDITKFYDVKEAYAQGEVDLMDELEGLFGIEDEETLHGVNCYGLMNWDFMDWEEFPAGGIEEEESEYCKVEDSGKFRNVKTENIGFWDEDDKRISLNLNLNYQEVLDAWSDRGPLWADNSAHNGYLGEVPVMEEDRSRREASVLRYKEKRNSRLFSKKIRYQVRKLNADQRPRLKGRFVKRVSEKILK